MFVFFILVNYITGILNVCTKLFKVNTRNIGDVSISVTVGFLLLIVKKKFLPIHFIRKLTKLTLKLFFVPKILNLCQKPKNALHVRHMCVYSCGIEYCLRRWLTALNPSIWLFPAKANISGDWYLNQFWTPHLHHATLSSFMTYGQTSHYHNGMEGGLHPAVDWKRLYILVIYLYQNARMRVYAHTHTFRDINMNSIYITCCVNIGILKLDSHAWVV